MIDGYFSSYLIWQQRKWGSEWESDVSKVIQLVIHKLEADPQGSEKPVEEEGTVCIGVGELSLEKNANNEEKENQKVPRVKLEILLIISPFEE